MREVQELVGILSEWIDRQEAKAVGSSGRENPRVPRLQTKDERIAELESMVEEREDEIRRLRTRILELRCLEKIRLAVPRD